MQMFKRDPSTAAIGEEILPFEMGYLPEFFQKKGEIELNYTQSVREKSLHEIKERMAKSNSMNSLRISDEVLLMFLTSRKHDVNRAFSQLKNYVNFRRKYVSKFKVPSYEVLSGFMTSELLTVLPWRCQDGCTLVLIQTGKYNSCQHSMETLEQYYSHFFPQCLRYPMSQVNGCKVIMDLNISLDFLRICTPSNLYRFYYGTLVLLPARIKEIHLVNMGVTGRAVWQIVRVFLPEKIRGRVILQKSVDGLLDYLPKAILPVTFGGDLTDYDMTEWLQRVSSPEGLSIMEF